MRALLGLFVIAASFVAGCSGDTSPADVRAKEDSIKKANEEMMKKNPPPPGEGPTD